MRITETAARMLSTAISNTVLIKEISTADAYERFYRDALSNDDMSIIARATGAEGGKLDPLTKFAFDFAKRSDDKESAVATAAHYASQYKQYIDAIQREDLRSKVHDAIKQCHSWSDIYRHIVMANESDGVRNEVRKRMEALYKVYEDQRMPVVAPLTFEAAKHYGGHSDWCTSKHERDFYHYCDDGQWIVMILFHDQDDEFTIDHQIAMRTNGLITFMKDENDDEIKDEEFMSGIMTSKGFIPISELEEIGDWESEYPIHNKMYDADALFDQEFGPELHKQIASKIQEIITLGMEWKAKKDKTQQNG